jgi:hypothetical protein
LLHPSPPGRRCSQGAIIEDRLAPPVDTTPTGNCATRTVIGPTETIATSNGHTRVCLLVPRIDGLFIIRRENARPIDHPPRRDKIQEKRP